MKHVSFFLLSIFMVLLAVAQESGGANLDVNITKNEGGGNIPWLWIIGGIVVLVLLIALLNGRGGRDTIVEKRTVVKD